MFTQCSNCNTVFELSAEVLRAAGGQVRCGRCGEIFNALARLAEDSSAFDVGESAYEMEERADSILESVPPDPLPPLEPEAPESQNAAAEEEYGDTEVAQLQVLDFSQDSFIDESVEDLLPEPEPEPEPPESALEFTLPPGELDRIFVESSVGVVPHFSSLGSLEPPAPEPPPETPVVAASELISFEELEPTFDDLAPLPAPETAPAPAPEETPELPELAELAKTAELEDDEPLSGIEVISDDRLTAVRPVGSPLADLDPFELTEPKPRSKASFGVWLAVAVVAALVLVGQVLHQNRVALAAHGPLAPLLRALYAGIGAPLSGTPNLAAFQLRQWGVTGDAAGDSTLRVRASILNATTQLQPFPLLRVTLANRYGTRIGTRDFAPNEYVGKPFARQLAPGEKIDAVLNILDPGKEAEGFEIDVCLPGADKKIVCANDASPAQARQ